jgi:hypothetical protein
VSLVNWVTCLLTCMRSAVSADGPLTKLHLGNEEGAEFVVIAADRTAMARLTHRASVYDRSRLSRSKMRRWLDIWSHTRVRRPRRERVSAVCGYNKHRCRKHVQWLACTAVGDCIIQAGIREDRGSQFISIVYCGTWGDIIIELLPWHTFAKAGVQSRSILASGPAA